MRILSALTALALATAAVLPANAQISERPVFDLDAINAAIERFDATTGTRTGTFNPPLSFEGEQTRTFSDLDNSPIVGTNPTHQMTETEILEAFSSKADARPEFTGLWPGKQALVLPPAFETITRPTGRWLSADGVVHGICPVGGCNTDRPHRYQLILSAERNNRGRTLETVNITVEARNLSAAVQEAKNEAGRKGYFDSQVVGVVILR